MSGDSLLREKRALYLTGIALVIIAAAILFILMEKQRTYVRDEMKSRDAALKAGSKVRVVYAKRSPTQRTIILTGEARPYAAVTLYAKVSGYLKEIRVDKGDLVSAGDVLAVIESPEIDRQYEAALVSAKDARRDAIRSRELVTKDYISQQDADHAETAARVAEANAEALKTQRGYEILRAPFAGTVTARFADPGALVQSAINSQTTALPVVTLSQTDRLRIYVYLNQRDAVFVHVGDQAEVTDAAQPGTKLSASVSRISGELDQNTRTLLTELDIDNRERTILAGSFVQVSLVLKTAPSVEIPADALLMKGEKAFVALITPQNIVNFRTVMVLESDGKTVRLSSGLSEKERVALNPGFGILHGEKVQPVVVPSQ